MALRSVNLIPEDVIYPRRVARHGLVWVGMLGLILALTGLAHLTILQRAHHRGLQGSPTVILEQDVRAALAKIKETQAELQRLATVRVIRRNDLSTRILMALSGTLNERSWLTHVGIVRPPDQSDAAVTLEGLSFSNAELGVFLNRINRHPAFRNVVLRYSREADGGYSENRQPRDAVKLIQFKIDCTACERFPNAPSPGGSAPADPPAKEDSGAP